MRASQDIQTLNLSVEVFNHLSAAEIITVGDLLKYYPNQLQSIKGIGPIKEQIIINEIMAFNLSYGSLSFDCPNTETINVLEYYPKFMRK